MRRLAIVTLLLLAFTAVSLAQENPATLPANVQFPAQVVNKLNSHKSKVGDEVKLEVAANLHGPGGAVVLPQGAKLIGTVTEVKDRNGADGVSELSFVITRAEWRGGSMALHAGPTAVTAPRVKTERDSAGGPGSDSGFGAGSRGGREGSTGGRGSGGTDTTSMIVEAIAREIKGLESRDTGDPKIGNAFVSHRDVSIPAGAIITLRQMKSEQ